ncbi:hypothetical protein [Alloyangia pacifica]|uniref:Uncharacterized protein n=1 Tax=Alloyangia pacifica TaxID=311180 RepID=A0A1I6SSR1_9RHOB|nr:hypothetical protein [Alloyangia pacifica]SDG86836.1 hypothetical protein SAMN04488245_10528 [Alloyangia pacifica]SFS79899.1 hypothetical protein SAMN04488050_10528 [Alloyangia pacifica]
MGIFNQAQTTAIEQLLAQGVSDFDIAQQVCPAGEDPELLLEAVSMHRERHDQATTA